MFACLHLPGLPIEAALNRMPDFRSHPCAVVADSSRPDDPKAPLLAVNFVAARHGIRAGESAIRARAHCPALRFSHCPALRFLERDLEAEQELHAALLELAESLSPDFESHRPDTLIVDLAGSRPPTIWNPPIPHLRLVLADTPDLAHLAAMVNAPFSGKPMELADFDPLPLGVLLKADVPGCEAFLPVFHLWGLRTLGDFRRLPRQEIAERMGPDAMRLHDVLHGRVCRLLKLHRSIESYVQIIHFDSDIESLEALLFQANRAFITICARLEANHLAAETIRFELSIESSDPIRRTLVLPEPLRSPAALLRPLHTVFETLRVPSGIVALELELEPVRPLSAQKEWLGRQLRQPERWADTLARLEALLGPGRVGIPEPEDSHRPDDFRLRPALEKCGTPPEDAVSPACPLPLRRFRPPLEVAVASTEDGSRPRPMALLTGPHPGPIRRLRGPFPVSGDWWSAENAWRRLEWDIELESSHLFRLVLLPPDRWQLDGAYA
jgi:protein ImuB